MKRTLAGAGLALWMVTTWLPLVPWMPYLWEIGKGWAKQYVEMP